MGLDEPVDSVFQEDSVSFPGPQNTRELVGQIPMPLLALLRGCRAGPVFHDQMKITFLLKPRFEEQRDSPLQHPGIERLRSVISL